METAAQVETLASIEAWSIPTFGPSPSLIVALSRANAELSELLMAAAQPVPDSQKIVMECADTAICMCRPASMLGDRPIDRIFNATDMELKQTTALAGAVSAQGMMLLLMHGVMSGRVTPREAGDLVDSIVAKLAAICKTLGAHLGAAISVKMPINRERKWRQTGEGIGHHIEE